MEKVCRFCGGPGCSWATIYLKKFTYMRESIIKHPKVRYRVVVCKECAHKIIGRGIK